MSMDVSGKIVWAKHSEIQQANLKAMGEAEHQDGERLPLAVKDLGACDIYPQTIAHNPNGRYCCAVGSLVTEFCVLSQLHFIFLLYLSCQTSVEILSFVLILLKRKQTPIMSIFFNIFDSYFIST